MTDNPLCTHCGQFLPEYTALLSDEVAERRKTEETISETPLKATIHDNGTTTVTSDNEELQKLFNIAAQATEEAATLRARCKALQDALLIVSGNWKQGKR